MTNGVPCLREFLKLTMVEHTIFSVLHSCPGIVLATRGWPYRSRILRITRAKAAGRWFRTRPSPLRLTA
ncbi:MAG: hypothetical protein MUO38_07855 [Anaerolineales bacterium]|nr:hypothetical protein [Anaerolineales bacterium]